MATNDFLPFATGGGANVETQATYAADPTTGTGFQTGIVESAKVNKVWRQSAFGVSALAQLIADVTGQNVSDDGVILNFEERLSLLLGMSNYGVDAGVANAYAVTYAPALLAVTDGLRLKFRVLNTNTGASTFNPSGLGAQPIWSMHHEALYGGELIAGGQATIEWNSTLNTTGAWVLLECTGVTKASAAESNGGTVAVTAGVDTSLHSVAIPVHKGDLLIGHFIEQLNSPVTTGGRITGYLNRSGVTSVGSSANFICPFAATYAQQFTASFCFGITQTGTLTLDARTNIDQGASNTNMIGTVSYTLIRGAA